MNKIDIGKPKNMGIFEFDPSFITNSDDGHFVACQVTLLVNLRKFPYIKFRVPKLDFDVNFYITNNFIIND